MASATGTATAAATGTAMSTTQAAQVHCRACWRALVAPDRTLRLPCGDAFCAACLGAHARAALASAAPLALPLRCCWTPVPVALLRGVLAPVELAFYAFRTQQRVAATRAQVVDAHHVLSTPCDFCMAPVRLATAHDVEACLLDCGHVYCGACAATLKQTAGATGALCCVELYTADAPIPAHAAAAALTMVQDTAEAAEEPRRRRVSARRTAVAPPTFHGKGKRKLQGATKPAADPTVVNLLDDTDDDDELEEEGATPAAQGGREEATEVCVKCATRVDAATNRFRAACGHVFCRACLHERCLRALRNEEQGSIGFPVRCCHALVAPELLRAVLSKRNFVKYEALVARRGTAALPTPPRATRKRKAVAATTTATTTAATEDKRKKQRTEDEADGTPAECVACMADVAVSDRLTGPCGHVYCLECLGMMARQSLEDRALVPIRCCSQEFPIDYVQRVVTRAQFMQYDRFLKEKDWRTSDLKSDKEYAAMVKAIDGKQCPTCGVGVQKISGCDAIRCLRGHLFCFACEAAPCTCGRTRLENYGWVPPGTLPNPTANAIANANANAFANANAAIAAARDRIFQLHLGPGVARGDPGGVPGNGIEAALAAINGRGAGLIALARARVPGGVGATRAGLAAAAAALAPAAAPAARAARARPKVARPKR